MRPRVIFAALSIAGCAVEPTDPGLEFTERASGELERTFVDCSDCCDDLVVHLLSTDPDLRALMEVELPGVPVPAVDFAARQAVVAYTLQCPNLGRELRADRIDADGTALAVDMTVAVTEYDVLSVETRPYVVLDLPHGDFTSASGTLTVEE